MTIPAITPEAAAEFYAKDCYRVYQALLTAGFGHDGALALTVATIRRNKVHYSAEEAAKAMELEETSK